MLLAGRLAIPSLVLARCSVNDNIAPAVLNVGNSASKGMCAETFTPVVDCVDELLADLRSADLEQANRTGRQREGPGIETKLRGLTLPELAG